MQNCDQALAHRRPNTSSLRVTIENAITLLLPHGKARRAAVAKELGMSSRTLARKMAAEELSFSKILNQLRSDLATYYLSDADLSISQIAWLVGYQGIGAFSHSYKALDRIECKEDARKVDSEPQENVSVGPKGDRL